MSLALHASWPFRFTQRGYRQRGTYRSRNKRLICSPLEIGPQQMVSGVERHPDRMDFTQIPHQGWPAELNPFLLKPPLQIHFSVNSWVIRD